MPTPEEMDQYGAGLSIWDQIRLFQDWAPLIGFGQRFVAEPDQYQRSLIVSDACEWLAAKTKSTADDQLVRLLADVAKAPQGEALIRFCLATVGAK
jgi:hypothetical protein